MNIYLVDDDQDDHFFFMEAMNSLEFSVCKVKSVYNGKELLEHLKTADEMPNAIVLDLNMPYMDGFETLGLLKSSLKFGRIPVFILTTSNKQVDVQKAVRLGCENFFTKPTQLSKLRSILLEILTKSGLKTVQCAPIALWVLT